MHNLHLFTATDIECPNRDLTGFKKSENFPVVNKIRNPPVGRKKTDEIIFRQLILQPAIDFFLIGMR